MLISIRWSSVWRQLFAQKCSRRHRCQATLTSVEHLEPRVVLTATAVVTETYRNFDFNVTGSANGHTIIPGGYFGETYHDNYNITLVPELSSGSVSFTSPTEGSGSASTSVVGTGIDNFGPYDIAYSGGGVGTVDNGELFDFFIFSPFPSDNFTKTGHFSSSSWVVSTSWSGAVFDEDTGAGDGTTSGSFSGFVNQDHLPLTDFGVTIDFNTAEAEAIHDDNHSVNQVAEAIKATITIQVSGQHMKSGTMGSPATYARIYLGDGIYPIVDPVPIHWNAGTVTIELTDFLPETVEDGKLRVVLDEDGSVPELDESNNEIEFDIPYDLEVTGLGWLPSGSVLAAFRIGEPGFSTGVIGGTFAEIFFADASNNYLDAFPDTPDVIDYLAAYSISALSTPQATNGDFLLFSAPLTWRPEGATKITALIDLFSIPHNADINPDNNFLSLALTELTVANPVWNQNGSVDFTVDVSGNVVVFDTSVSVYWSSGDPQDPVLTKITELDLNQGAFGQVPFHVSAGTLGTPPAGTDALVILPDAPFGSLQFGKILEPIENIPALLPPNPLELEFTVMSGTSPFFSVKPEGVDAGSYQIEEGQGPEHGQVSMFGDGTFFYTPDEGYVGDDQFDYYIQGQDGRSLTATVTIHVIPFNGTPLAQDNEFQLEVNTPLQGTLTATDEEGDGLTYSLDLAPEHGTVDISEDGTFTYTPNGGYVGFDGFSFVVSDGTTTSVPGFIGLSIESSNTNPVISDQSFNVDEGSAFGATVGTIEATDDEGDELTFGIVDGNDDAAFAIDPATGEIMVNNSAALVFATHPTFSLTVGVMDDGIPNLSSTATVTITVKQLGAALNLNLGGGAATFTKKHPPVDVLPNIIVQVPGNNIGGGRLVISVDLVRKGTKAFDTIPGLSFASLLGTVHGPAPLSDGRMQLSIDLDSFIRGEDVQTFLRSFKLTTRGRGLKVPQRTVRVQLFDADGNASNVLQQTINVRKR